MQLTDKPYNLYDVCLSPLISNFRINCGRFTNDYHCYRSHKHTFRTSYGQSLQTSLLSIRQNKELLFMCSAGRVYRSFLFKTFYRYKLKSVRYTRQVGWIQSWSFRHKQNKSKNLQMNLGRFDTNKTKGKNVEMNLEECQNAAILAYGTCSRICMVTKHDYAVVSI